MEEKVEKVEKVMKTTLKLKRSVVQLFTRGDVALALCNDGTVWSFKETFKDGKETVIWNRQEKYENPS